MKHSDYEELSKEIWEHNRLYYIENAPKISDEEYDRLIKNLEEMEKAHPEWITPTSPTQRTGDKSTTAFNTVEHKIPMLSLANTYSKDELENFLKRVEKLLGKKTVNYCSELKMDGISVSVIYEKGRFLEGSTRGDGKRGDEITQNLKTIQNLPLELHGSHIPDYLEVRGEVYMTHSVFQRLNEERKRGEESLWANPRNAAGGALKLLDPKEVSKRSLSIVFYGVAQDSSHEIHSQYASHQFLKKMGLPTLAKVARCHSLDEIWSYAEEIHVLRRSYPFDIDGIVVKVDDFKEHVKLGTIGKTPRWAVAFKFAAERAVTRIKDITVQVGRTGVLTPVAELVPVLLAGSTISRATLHNEDEVIRKDIRIGDRVVIEKGGDVIPKVVSVELVGRPQDSKPWRMPEKCPSCGVDVERVKGEVAVRCPNFLKCPDQKLKKLIHFSSKVAMDIDNMGERVVEQLVELGLVKNTSDIFKLTREDLYRLNNFKDKAVENLYSSIQRSKEISLERFIMALGIPHVGAGMAELLAKRFGDICRLMSVTKEELLEIEGVGDILAESIVDYFLDPLNKEEIEQILRAGVHPKKLEVVSFKEHLFSGKMFCLTGTLSRYTRQAAASLIKERGGSVRDSVTKKTDFVVAGEDPGSKLDKAKELGIAVLDENEFEKRL